METTMEKRAVFQYIWFKSYYVVWKQQEWKEIDDGKDEFKSYYVVWKRHIFTGRRCECVRV